MEDNLKYCIKCGRWLTKDKFSKHKSGKDGLRNSCKECEKEYHKKWREANRDKDLARKKEYYQENKDKELARKQKWANSPRGQILEFNRHNKRRAKEQAQGDGITTEQWLEMMQYFNWRCAYSGKTLTKNTRSIDHIIPIGKHGPNEIWNVVPMYKSYNCSKRDKDMEEWYRNQEYFSEERLAKIREWQEYAYKKYSKK